jgi:uncharacterized repeat protein (TIGR01451 family)
VKVKKRAVTRMSKIIQLLFVLSISLVQADVDLRLELKGGYDCVPQNEVIKNVSCGATIVQQVKVRNHNSGSEAAHNILVSGLRTPNGLVYVSDDGQGSFDPVSGVWSAGSLALNKNKTLGITYRAVAGGRISMSASVTSDEVEIDPSSNVSCITYDVAGCSSDVQITLEASPDQFVRGQSAMYRIVVANNGPDAAVDIELDDTFPLAFENVTWTALASGGGLVSNASGIGDIVDELIYLPKNAKATYLVSGTIASGAVGSTVNTATITHDGVLANAQTTTSISGPTATNANINMSCYIEERQGCPDGLISYVLLIENRNVVAPDENLSNVSVVMDFGDYVFDSLVSASNVTSYDHGADTWYVGSLAAGGSEELILQLVVPSGPVCGVRYPSPVVCAKLMHDTTVYGVEVCAGVDVARTSKVDMVISQEPKVEAAGERVVYRLTALNEGPCDLDDVDIKLTGLDIFDSIKIISNTMPQVPQLIGNPVTEIDWTGLLLLVEDLPAFFEFEGYINTPGAYTLEGEFYKALGQTPTPACVTIRNGYTSPNHGRVAAASHTFDITG